MDDSLAPGGTDFSAALIPGEWKHQFVSANGSRFHFAQAGPTGIERPLVVLLHGFGQFWWAWRHQLVALGNAGYRVAAMDLRGYAASDKPPTGYTLPDLAADVAAVIHSLGASRAVVVGQGLGGLVAWTMTATHPDVLTGACAVDAPHPLAPRIGARALATPLALAQVGLLKGPVFAERAIEQGDLVGHLLRTWSGFGWPSHEDVATYRALMRVPFAASKALEQLRWAIGRFSGGGRRRFSALFEAAPTTAILHIQGAADHLVRASLVSVPDLGGEDYHWALVPGAGHFVPEEAPDACSTLLLGWLAGLTT
ncbi:MAG: alpha/beta hydrolase [Bifidobacteriaceae bacterium]|jgi:pimeloyl-ACP methyl ester carboxylesterase|nr:alpha/beta hydrolase [Bifidobacteriaceae bacterium]